MSQAAARVIARQVLSKPDSVLGLPTGETPIGMYETLVHMYDQGLIDFSRIVTFNLDEYYTLSPDHPNRYHRYMYEKLFMHVNVPEGNIHIPDGGVQDGEAECRRYDEELVRYGRINLQVLGIGTNGHIGFNEPGTAWGLTTHVSDLSPETREWEARSFAEDEPVPRRAITMGIKTIMNAEQIMLLASGEEKAKAVAAALFGPITPQVPASVLQLHPQLTVALDKAAEEKFP